VPKTVLVIDDEPELLRLLDYNLTKAGYLAISARDGPSGLALARRHAPDLVILDILMPGMDGLEVCKALRGDPATAGIPILILTAKAEEADRVLGLELGADDYVCKPFGVRELLARVKALLRRGVGSPAPEVLAAGRLVVDQGRRQVTVGDQEIPLTATEFNILRVLVERRGRVLTRQDLLERARGEDATASDRTIDVHVSSLRRKLGREGRRIQTVRGVGYRLKE